ncbi:TPA: hypothetical protein PRW77_004030, partial [Escherichia coli]|nr:hypothetical protein [Escherichia coli]
MRSLIIFNKHIAVSCCDSHRRDSPTYRLFSDKFNAGTGGITVSTNRDGHFVV